MSNLTPAIMFFIEVGTGPTMYLLQLQEYITKWSRLKRISHDYDSTITSDLNPLTKEHLYSYKSGGIGMLVLQKADHRVPGYGTKISC